VFQHSVCPPRNIWPGFVGEDNVDQVVKRIPGVAKSRLAVLVGQCLANTTYDLRSGPRGAVPNDPRPFYFHCLTSLGAFDDPDSSDHRRNRERQKRRRICPTFRTACRLGETALDTTSISGTRLAAADRQRLALVYPRQHEHVNNAEYRRLNRVDATTAGSGLRGFTDTGLVGQEEFGRWTFYRLKAASELSEQREPQT